MSEPQVNEFAFRIFLLFFPGIICSLIVNTFTSLKKSSSVEFFINSFVYGVISYLFCWAWIKYCLPLFFCTTEIPAQADAIFQPIFDSNKTIQPEALLKVTVTSLILSILMTLAINRKWFFRLAHIVHITSKFAEKDVWGFFMNSPEINWVIVRDIKNDLMYEGWIQAFSDSYHDAEIVLQDVKVFRNSTEGDAEHLYDVKTQYLSLEKNAISIEVRKPDNQK